MRRRCTNDREDREIEAIRSIRKDGPYNVRLKLPMNCECEADRIEEIQ